MSIELIKGDITCLPVDAIVNAANESLLGGGGVDGAIHRKAGPGLLKECRKLNGCRKGEAKLTGGYQLPAKHVIHTVGPIFGREKGKEEAILADCYLNSLKLAKDNGFKNIAFPAISTGAYGFPIDRSAEIALKTATDFDKANPLCFDRIIFVLFSELDYEVYRKEVRRLEKSC